MKTIFAPGNFEKGALALTLVVTLGMASLSAQDLPSAEPTTTASPEQALVDELLPQPVTPGHFELLNKQSPFLRTLSLTDTYALRGVAEIDGESVATLFNRDSKKSIVVTMEAANEEGMKLVEVVPGEFLTGVSAKIAVGSEQVELKFENDRIAPQPKGGSSRSGGGDSKGGERRGPSKEDIERYKSLSEEQKGKLRDFIRQTMQKYPNMSREERGNLIRGAMTKLADGRDIDVDSSSSSNSGGDRSRSGGGDSNRSGGGGDRDRR